LAVIYVDADACPVKDEALRVAVRHKLKVVFVSNQWMRGLESPLVEQVVVENRPDAADDLIAERAGPGDIVITADIPLASRALEKGAEVLNHTGKPFTEAGIGMALAMRDLMSGLRETGEVSGRNAAFGKADRSRFLNALEAAAQAAARS
jgi:uncharacterized protein YaiI (UPF0178 family)